MPMSFIMSKNVEHNNNNNNNNNNIIIIRRRRIMIIIIIIIITVRRSKYCIEIYWLLNSSSFMLHVILASFGKKFILKG